MRRNIAAILAAALFAASPAWAGSVDFKGSGGQGDFRGSLSYSTDSPFASVGVLTVILSNVSDPDNGGYITGFLFNIGSEGDAPSATLLSDPSPSHPFEQVMGKDLDGAPYGMFDAGAALGGKFLGGGNPKNGIAVGAAGTFNFQIAAPDAGQLTAADFIGKGPNDVDFLVRFRGFLDGTSDKVAATVVPLPAPLALGLAGLVGVGALKRFSHRGKRVT